MRRLRLWLVARVRARRLASLMEEEFAFHIDLERRRLVDAGWSPRDARTKATRRFGHIARIRSECEREYLGSRRPAPPHRWSAEMLINDFRYAVRSLIKNPGLTLVVGGTLALGIGATTAVFSVLNSVILQPLPYHEPDRLVRLYDAHPENPGRKEFVTSPDFRDLREQVAAFDTLAALYTYREVGFDLLVGDRPRRIRALRVSPGYFEVFRTTPLLGRTFTPEEERGWHEVAVLSHALWRNAADADPEIVGKRLMMDGTPYTVVGVARPNFFDVVAGDVDVWIPRDLWGGSNSRGNHYLSIIGRLEAEITLGQAQAELDAVAAGLAQEYPDSNRDRIFRLDPLFDDVVGASEATLFVLMGAAAFVLLIACVNVGNLSLARSVARTREFAVRAALGSGRGRLISQLLVESLVLAALGGAVGLALTFWGVEVLLAMSPESLARADEIAFDPVLLGFAATVTIATGIVFGLAPAIQFARMDLSHALREGARGTGGVRKGRIRNLLVAGQVSLALMLLIGAGVLMKSFAALQRVELGIEPDGVTTFEVHLPTAQYDPEQRSRFHRALHERLRALPGIRAAGAVSKLPASGAYHTWWSGYLNDDGEVVGSSFQIRVVEGDYFAALGIRLVQGRFLTDADRVDGRMVALMNEAAAADAFPNRDPIGEIVGVGGDRREIVGIVSNVAHDRRGAFGRKIYLPHAQFADDRNWALTQVVATERRRDDFWRVVDRELSALDPNLVLYQPNPLDHVLGQEIARERFALTIMACFAGVALTLAAIGIHGVLSYAVHQRSHEIGIRMALGARASQVRRIVVSQGAALAAGGIVVGLGGAMVLSRLLGSLVFGVSVLDPVIFASVPTVLGIVALLAGYLPARRATRVDPTESLREE